MCLVWDLLNFKMQMPDCSFGSLCSKRAGMCPLFACSLVANLTVLGSYVIWHFLVREQWETHRHSFFQFNLPPSPTSNFQFSFLLLLWTISIWELQSVSLWIHFVIPCKWTLKKLVHGWVKISIETIGWLELSVKCTSSLHLHEGELIKLLLNDCDLLKAWTKPASRLNFDHCFPFVICTVISIDTLNVT